MGESPTGRDAPAGSSRSDCGDNEAVEAFGNKRVTIYGDVASVQAVTRVKAEQLEKDNAGADPTLCSNKSVAVKVNLFHAL